MKRCSKCFLPETQETIVFDSLGSCNICAGQTIKNESLDWEKKGYDLRALVEEHRGKYDYDCIVPFSGGKDSTWTLYYLVKEFGLKPLVVRFDHGFMRPNLEENVKNTQRELGVDIMTFTPNWHVVRRLMLQSFLEKGDFCWHCHTGIFSYPMWIALEKKVPLIIWGEPSSEYTAYFSYDQEETVDENRFNRFVNLGISADDMYIRLNGEVDRRDLKPYSYPPLKDLRRLDYRSVCLGSYIPWDVPKQSKIIMDELGWKGDKVENVPPQYSYEKIECYMQGVRDHIKYVKRGFTRPSH
jgi:N-acetyl sugar amidotransferase